MQESMGKEVKNRLMRASFCFGLRRTSGAVTENIYHRHRGRRFPGGSMVPVPSQP
jgi:hypothetical protein